MSGPSPSRAFLGLGGNLGDPARLMGLALRRIDADAHASVGAVSALYRTPPWGKVDQPDFLNAAAEVHTSLPPRDLLDLCLATERDLKRVRGERWGPRLIDIDVLVYGETSMREEGFELPHPRMLERAFVLKPLADIAPDLEIAGTTVAERLASLSATGIERLHGQGTWWLG